MLKTQRNDRSSQGPPLPYAIEKDEREKERNVKEKGKTTRAYNF